MQVGNPYFLIGISLFSSFGKKLSHARFYIDFTHIRLHRLTKPHESANTYGFVSRWSRMHVRTLLILFYNALSSCCFFTQYQTFRKTRYRKHKKTGPMCTICKILHYICTKEKHTNQTKSYEIHKRKLLCRTSKNGCSGCILYICLLSHQQKLAEKRLYFILTAIHRHLRLFVTPAWTEARTVNKSHCPLITKTNTINWKNSV